MKEKERERKKNWGVGSGGFFHSFLNSDSFQFPHISTTRSLWRSSGGTQAQAQAQVQAQGCMRPSSKKEENSIASSILTGFSVLFLYFYYYFFFFCAFG